MYERRSRFCGVRRTTTGRRSIALSITGSIAVVLLMVLGPASAARATPQALTAPFHGTSSSSNFNLASMCGNVGGTNTGWTASTGAIHGASKASVHSCPVAVSNFSEATSEHTEVVAIPFHVTTNSFYNVSAKWKFSLDSVISETPRVCPAAYNWSAGYDYVYCVASADTNAVVTEAIFDESTQSTVASSLASWDAENQTESYVKNWCDLGSCGSYVSSGFVCSSFQYQSPDEDQQGACLSNGTSAGAVPLWTNTSTWMPIYGTGWNVTLYSFEKYELVVSVELYAYALAFAEQFENTGLPGSSASLWYMPSGASASALLGGLTSAGDGLTVTSIAASPVV